MSGPGNGSGGTRTASSGLPPSESDPVESAAERPVGLLDGLPVQTVRAIEHAVREVRLPAGAVLFEAGEPSDALYAVRSGLVDVIGRGTGGPTRLLTIGPGESVGEQSLLTGRTRSATAVAQTGVTLWRLDHADFVALLATDPHLGAAVGRTVSERLSSASRARLGLPRGQTVLVCSREASAAADTARCLGEACARLLGEAPVLLAAGPESAWSTTALPGDAVFHTSDALPGAAVRAVRERGLVVIACAELVPAALIEGADHLVAVAPEPEAAHARGAKATHALTASSDEATVAALARTICGRRVGVALGSGGIRGFAHAGVLEVLVAEKIPIDFVSGASAGAIVGALFLRGVPPRAMTDLIGMGVDTVRTGLPSFSLSPQALLSGRRLLTYLRQHLGRDTRIEDLPTPFVIATTDPVTRGPVHLDTGPLPESVAASTAVPGIFAPVSVEGRRLVDGATADPVPVTALRERGADIVVAVNVMSIGTGPLGAFVHMPRLRVPLPGGRAFQPRLPLPGLLENLFIGVDIVTSQIAVHATKQADVVVEPQPDALRWYEVMPARAYRRAGADAMRAALPRVRELVGT